MEDTPGFHPGSCGFDSRPRCSTLTVAIIEVGLLTVDDLRLLSKQTVVCAVDRHGQPALTSRQMARADFVVTVRPGRPMVLVKSRKGMHVVGDKVFEDRVRIERVGTPWRKPEHIEFDPG